MSSVITALSRFDFHQCFYRKFVEVQRRAVATFQEPIAHQMIRLYPERSLNFDPMTARYSLHRFFSVLSYFFTRSLFMIETVSLQDASANSRSCSTHFFTFNPKLQPLQVCLKK